MPFRLDYALWGLSLAITLSRRGHLVLSTDGKYLRMKYVTWLIDYMYLGANMYFADMFLSKNLTPENVLFHQMANSAFVVAIDLLKGVLFANLAAKAKIDHIKYIAKEGVKMIFTAEGIKDNFRFLGTLLKGEGTLFEWSDGKAVRKSVRHIIWYFVKIGVSDTQTIDIMNGHIRNTLLRISHIFWFLISLYVKPS